VTKGQKEMTDIKDLFFCDEWQLSSHAEIRILVPISRFSVLFLFLLCRMYYSTTVRVADDKKAGKRPTSLFLRRLLGFQRKTLSGSRDRSENPCFLLEVARNLSLEFSM